MSKQRIVSSIAGLSVLALLLATYGMHAGVTAAAAPAPIATTSNSLPTGRISAEPNTGLPAPGTPPQASPLAPPPSPMAERAATAARGAADPVTSSARLAITAAVTAPQPPPPRSSDVIDDGAPITESVFDKEDLTDHHPVDSDGPITESVFDKEDLVDHHPVP
jgi:hypothetical protein